MIIRNVVLNTYETEHEAVFHGHVLRVLSAQECFENVGQGQDSPGGYGEIRVYFLVDEKEEPAQRVRIIRVQDNVELPADASKWLYVATVANKELTGGEHVFLDFLR